jgi:hypothetical protein
MKNFRNFECMSTIIPLLQYGIHNTNSIGVGIEAIFNKQHQ